MLKKEIKPALEALKKIRMPKIEDKDLRNAIIKNHLFLLGQAKKFDADVLDLRTVHLGSYEAELQEINEKQAALNVETDAVKRKELIDEINSHTDLLAAINAFNKAVMDKENEVIEVTQVDSDKFAEEYGKQEYDCAVVEALFPLFK